MLQSLRPWVARGPAHEQLRCAAIERLDGSCPGAAFSLGRHHHDGNVGEGVHHLVAAHRGADGEAGARHVRRDKRSCPSESAARVEGSRMRRSRWSAGTTHDRTTGLVRDAIAAWSMPAAPPEMTQDPARATARPRSGRERERVQRSLSRPHDSHASDRDHRTVAGAEEHRRSAVPEYLQQSGRIVRLDAA